MMEERKMINSRSVEVELEIGAPVEAVWKALTEAEEISRWFSPQAQTNPGAGGSIRWTWDENIDWESRIEIWENNRHLRTVYDRTPGGVATPTLLAMDFYLEGRSGTTVLRLVHSGFGRGADWDEEYDGVSRGWAYELRSLRHYLENHRGEPRQIVWARRTIRAADEEAWQRLMGPDGLLRHGRIDGVAEGDRYEITAATGDTFRGEVVFFAPPKEFGGTVENLNNALLRVAVEKCGEQPEAWVWLSAYGLPEAELEGFRDRWTTRLHELFPEAKSA